MSRLVSLQHFAVDVTDSFVSFLVLQEILACLYERFPFVPEGNRSKCAELL